MEGRGAGKEASAGADLVSSDERDGLHVRGVAGEVDRLVPPVDHVQDPCSKSPKPHREQASKRHHQRLPETDCCRAAKKEVNWNPPLSCAKGNSKKTRAAAPLLRSLSLRSTLIQQYPGDAKREPERRSREKQTASTHLLSLHSPHTTAVVPDPRKRDIIHTPGIHCRSGCCLPLGKPASVAMDASIMAAPGHFSDGFITNVFPAAIARGNIHSGIIAGKLKGQIPAKEQRGRLARHGRGGNVALSLRLSLVHQRCNGLLIQRFQVKCVESRTTCALPQR